DNVGILGITGFSNLRELENYRRVMTNRDFQLPEGVRPIMISKHNFELLLKEGRSFEEYFRFEENAMAEEAVDAALEGETDSTDEPEDSEPSEVSELPEESEQSDNMNPEEPEQSENPEEPETPEQSL
ncbi:MAG: hypothetical protein K2F93_08110, partial [Muribaculaceae bacterium]|nr:hypothetical protein [Muribaculaceae bacterium]